MRSLVSWGFGVWLVTGDTLVGWSVGACAGRVDGVVDRSEQTFDAVGPGALAGHFDGARVVGACRCGGERLSLVGRRVGPVWFVGSSRYRPSRPSSIASPDHSASRR